MPATRGRTRRLVRLGRPLPGMQVRIVDEQSAVLGARGVGVIEVRGGPVTPGYTTLAGFLPAQDEQGWYDTGDLGYLTDTGDIVVCGRVKELITVAGRNVFPTEVERVAAQVRGVREGAVVAVGADGGSARPGLVITAEFRGPDEAGARSELVALVASECGVVPADVVFVSPGTLPRTSSGKLRRLEVKRNLEAANQ